MEEDIEAKLLEEYRANVELWKHDDNLRQQRIGNFLTTNTILLVALGTLLSIKHDIKSLALSAILISIFGLLISFFCLSILNRNAQYIRFRRAHLKYLERKMPPMSTFTNTYDAFYEHKTLEYQEIDQTFSIPERGKKSSTITEGNLPVLIIIFWALVFLTGLGVLIF
ncbi:MAG: hypothetical protein IPP72_15360 [Chitinophagaceae bacterium]|nr:hypothetical protein [Chitinophagaceae bacterium]